MKKILLSMLLLSSVLVHAQKFEDFMILKKDNDLIATLHNTTNKHLLVLLYVDLEYADGTVEKNVEVVEYPLRLSMSCNVINPNEYKVVKFLTMRDHYTLPKTYKIRKIYFLKKK